MKWIKSYKLFESVNEDDISDILLELVDEGFKVDHSDPYLNVDYFPLSGSHVSITSMRHQETFKWGVAKDTILRLLNYLGDNMIRMQINTPGGLLSRIGDIKSLSDDSPIIAIRIFYKIKSNYWRIRSIDSLLTKDLVLIALSNFIKLNGNELHTIDDLLEPIKSYLPGHHSNDPDYIKRATEHKWSTFGRSVVFYPQGGVNRIVNGNQRGGYTWFLREGEISINKFDNGLFLIVFKGGVISAASSSTAFFAKDLDTVVFLIRKYV
jgi:hypothetical protein